MYITPEVVNGFAGLAPKVVSASSAAFSKPEAT